MEDEDEKPLLARTSGKRKRVRPARYDDGGDDDGPEEQGPKGRKRRSEFVDEERTGSFEINGMTVETIGNYSICPKCKKKIKSTFIIR